MNKGNLPGLSIILGLIFIGVACNQTAGNGNAAANQNAMNHNQMMNQNSMTNHNGTMNANHNMSQTHSEMMKSDPNAASAPFDLQFIDTMTHHHEGAIRMAEMALQKSNDEELKKFAQKIIDDQRKESGQMKGWRETWYAGKPPARNMEMSGMMDSMKMMSGDHMKLMESMTGRDFDLHFLDMMTPHHEGAVKMAKDATQKAEHAEIKTLAAEIIKEQEAEIKKMRDWKAKWSK